MKMKAVVCTVYGPPEVLQITEIEKPVPKPDEVLIKVLATTVTIADFRIRSFTVPSSFWIPARLALGIIKPRKPVLGVEISGEVEAVGANVTRFKTGDTVFAATLATFGGYAQYKCLKENTAIAIKPSNLSFEEAAAIPVGARTALHYMRRGNIASGKNILIYGASGSVGTYAVQLAKHFGATVTGVCSTINLELVKSLGADKVIDYTDGDFTKKLEQYDSIMVVIDKWPFATACKFLKEDGVYMNVTAPLKSFSMMWTSWTTKKKVIPGENPADSQEDLVLLKELAEANILKPVMDRTYTLDNIVEAHHYVGQGHKKGNVAITVKH